MALKELNPATDYMHDFGSMFFTALADALISLMRDHETGTYLSCTKIPGAQKPREITVAVRSFWRNV